MANFVPITASRIKPPFIAGFHSRLDTVAPDTIVILQTGVCSDSTNTLDILSTSEITIDCATVGAGGIDTGVLVLNELYYVHVIADSSNHRLPSAVMSLSIDDPVMPDGYDVKRMVDFKTTDGDADLRLSITYGPYAKRFCIFDAPVAVVTTTAKAAFTAVDLSALVPPIDIPNAQFSAALTPIAAADTLVLRATGATGEHATLSGSVIAVVKTADLECPIFVNATTSVPSIDYKTNALGTAVTTIKLKSFSFNV